MRLSKSTVLALRDFWGHHLKRKTLQHWATKYKRNDRWALPEVDCLIPPKGRIRSPMPVRESRQRGFQIARRIQQSRIEAMIRRRLHWEMMSALNATEPSRTSMTNGRKHDES